MFFARIAFMATVSFLCLAGLSAGLPDAPVERDRQAILAMAGNYIVDFHFEETVGFPLGYETTPAYDSSALETILVVEDTPEKIVLQHVLKTKKGIIKHWRQDWEYQNRELWEFHGHKTWKKRRLARKEAAGTWTQRVYQVDDSPRYEAVGRWIHHGSLSQWESEPTNRPLPRREYTKRDDYHILVARNRHTLTQTGWVHEQDNYKLRLGDDGRADEVIAREFGLNTYDRTLESRLDEARDWWAIHQTFWRDVRTVWNETFATNDHIRLTPRLENKPLYRHLFDLDKELAGKRGYDNDQAQKKIRDIIDRFMASEEAGTTETSAGKKSYSTKEGRP